MTVGGSSWRGGHLLSGIPPSNQIETTEQGTTRITRMVEACGGIQGIKTLRLSSTMIIGLHSRQSHMRPGLCIAKMLNLQAQVIPLRPFRPLLGLLFENRDQILEASDQQRRQLLQSAYRRSQRHH